MKKRKKVLQPAKKLLESANLPVDDFVQTFPFEVMYEGLIRSQVPLEGKKPLGVIFENHLIMLKSSSEEISWYDAMKYCRRIKVGGHFCNAGSIKLWKKLINSSQLKVLDDLLIELGGELLSGKWHWSSSEYSNCNAWVFCMDGSNGASWGSVDYFNKDNNYSYFIVRPVLDLSDLSY